MLFARHKYCLGRHVSQPPSYVQYSFSARKLSIFEGVSAKVSTKGPAKNVLLLFHIMQHFQHEEDKYALYYPSNAPWFDNCVPNSSIKMQIVDFYTATCSLFLEIKQRKILLKYVCLLPFKAVLGAYFDRIWKWNAL